MRRLRKGDTTEQLGLFSYRIETKILECGWGPELDRGCLGI